MKIEWLDNAREDIFAIYAWYAKDSRKTARNYVKVIATDADLLAENPRCGHLDPSLEDLEYEFRTLLTDIEHYRIIYFIDEEKDTVFINRIWDTRQNPSKLRRSLQKKK